MTELEYQEHIRHTHNAFCRIVIRHAAIDMALRLRKQWQREISLDYLMYEKFVPFSTTDDYFKEPEPCEEYPFTVCGQTVTLYDGELAAALSLLPKQAQEEVFQYYFQHRTLTEDNSVKEDTSEYDAKPNIEFPQLNQEEDSTDTGKMTCFEPYIVQSGDTLVSICNQAGVDYNSTYRIILSVNGITNANEIYAGQTVLLPINQ